MLAIQIFILSILLFIVPTIIGVIFTNASGNTAKLPFMWICGQVTLWAGFQCICVPLILQEKDFTLVVKYFNIFTGVLLVIALITGILRKIKRKATGPIPVAAPLQKNELILWLVFAGLLLLQLILAACLAYEEGDDAFYVAISTSTANSDTMYQKLPYRGTATTLDARHGLAPFPIWISYLARLSGMPAVTISQIVLPIVLIIMTYALYYMIGKAVLGTRTHLLPLFMIFIELLVLFGGYSTYSAENFLLVRTAQGKAVIANIIIPFLILLLILLLEKVQKTGKSLLQHWILFALTMLAGCLCSTLGTLLSCMLLGIAGLCAIFSYRKWTFIFPMGVCFIAPVCFALLYFLLA